MLNTPIEIGNRSDIRLVSDVSDSGISDTCDNLGSAVGRRAIGNEHIAHMHESPFHDFSNRRRFVLGRDKYREPVGDRLPLLGRNELGEAMLFEVFDFVALLLGRRVHDEICDVLHLYGDCTGLRAEVQLEPDLARTSRNWRSSGQFLRRSGVLGTLSGTLRGGSYDEA